MQPALISEIAAHGKLLTSKVASTFVSPTTFMGQTAPLAVIESDVYLLSVVKRLDGLEAME